MPSAQMVYIFGGAYIIELWCMKAAFIAFYWGLFVGMQSKRRYSLHISTVIVAASFIGVICVYLFWTTPIDRNWSVLPLTALGDMCGFIY